MRLAARPLAAALLVGALVVALQLPFLRLGVSLFDEGAILQTADTLLRGGRLYVDAVHYAFPGVFWLVAAAFRVGGETIATARLVAVLVFAAATVATWAIARWWMGPRGAAAVVALMLAYRVWAYPHWQAINYAPLAMALLLVATWLVGQALARGRVAWLVAGGATLGAAVLSKQDSGAAGTIVLGVATLLVWPGGVGARVGAVAALALGWLAAFGAGVAVLAAQGALAAAVDVTLVMTSRNWGSFPYLHRPPLWPLFAPDPTLRHFAFSYLPAIVFDLYWAPMVHGALWRDTGVIDTAVKLPYYLPWPVLAAAAAGLVVARRRAGAWTLALRRLALLVALALACALAFNRPHDWVHLLVLYPPTLLLLALGGWWALRATRARRVAAWLVVGGVLVGSAWLALQLRAALSAPVATARGLLRATPAQAATLQGVLDAIARRPAGAPVVALPYHPLVAFLAARPSPSRWLFAWPGDPPEPRDAELAAALDAHPDTVVVYSAVLAPETPRLAEASPALFDYLARHYVLAEGIGAPDGLTFLVLDRAAAPAGRRLLDALPQATVRVGGAPPTDRGAFAGLARWPFADVLRIAVVADTPVDVAFAVVPTAGTHLRAGAGFDPDRWFAVPPPRARFVVAVRDDAGEHVAWAADLDPWTRAADRRWVPVDVDLSAWAGRTVDVILRVVGPPGAGTRPDVAGFADPRLVGP